MLPEQLFLTLPPLLPAIPHTRQYPCLPMQTEIPLYSKCQSNPSVQPLELMLN